MTIKFFKDEKASGDNKYYWSIFAGCGTEVFKSNNMRRDEL